MNTKCKVNLKLSVISLAVARLFVTHGALADDAELKALTQPQSTVQVEVIGVDNQSAKFGEYNGLYGHPSGAYPNGALSIRGGGAYTGNEQGETTRWGVTGENLGLTSRSAGASISNQGSWNFGVNYDQLQHNITDTYQTPYQGTMGGNNFTLPNSFTSTMPLASVVCGAGSISPAGMGVSCLKQSNGFQGMSISSTRYNTTVNGTAVVDSGLNFTFEYNNLVQSGAKLQAFAGAFKAAGTGGAATESISILPTPTKYTTDTLNLAVNWKNENAHLTASYFGSFFQDAYNSVQWQPFSQTTTAASMQTMPTAPSNTLNQLNLSGGYDLSSKTKLTSNLSYGINTQNTAFAYDSGMMFAGYTPSQNSMNGLVNTTHADIKLADHSIKDLGLAALVKFDQRDNQTQSNMYNFYSVGTAGAYMPNTPMSIKQLQLQLSGDYKLTQAQKLNITYANENINRWCNQYGSQSSTLVTGAGAPVATSGTLYANSPNCVSATGSQENKLNATYKIKAAEDLSFKLAAGYSQRHTDWDSQAIASLPYKDTVMTAGVGKNSENYPGFQPFFEASRKQAIAKASTTWDATDRLSFNLGGKYTNDTYPNSTYGVQNGYSWSLNLDGNYVYAEDGSVGVYATQQNMQRALVQNASVSAQSLTAAAGGTWQNQLATNATTLGLAAKQGGLMNGKLTLGTDLTYSIANSNYNTQSNVANGCTTTGSINTGVCGGLPAIQNNLAVLKFNGTYQLDKNSKIGLSYWYQHLYSNDYYYNASQYGYVQASSSNGLLPTGQQSPSYSVNVISANYTYTFD